MKILQINSAKNFGGGEKHLLDLCRGLQNRGNEIFVALRPDNEWEEMLDFLPNENLIHLPLRNSADVFSAKELAKFINQQGIEIVHAHVARDYSIAALASRISQTPLILTRHLTYKLNILHHLTLKQAKKIIAVSQGVARSLQNLAFAEKIAVIYNGVDVSEFQKTTKNDELFGGLGFDSNLVVATIGELREHKGQEDFIEAAAKIIEKIPNVKFLIVGKDNSQKQDYRKRLEDLVQKLNLQNNIIFAGWQDKMSDIYNLIDIFISSARSEPFGLVIAEAMAAGKAVVATKTFGASELLVDNESGKLVTIGDTVSLAKAVSELLNNQKLRIRLGSNAQQRVEKLFSLDKMVSETEKIYQTVKLRQ